VDEETSRIKQHIDAEREQLGRNIDEIEHRVRKATDLKSYFDRHTGLILGAAVAGGVLLARAFPASSQDNSLDWDRDIAEQTSSTSTRAFKSHLGRLSETLDDIFDGLVAVVSDQMRSFVADAVPGFRERYDAIDQQRKRA
jgi:hypothetical protein